MNKLSINIYAVLVVIAVFLLGLAISTSMADELNDEMNLYSYLVKKRPISFGERYFGANRNHN